MRQLADIDRRLLNWARYVWMMQGGGGFASGSMTEERVDGEGYDAPTVIPVCDHEAEETHQGVQTLRGELRAATECWYLAPGGVAQKCRRLCVSETTLRARVGMAHWQLSQWLSDKATAARAQRERVEALQRAAKIG